MAASYLLPEAVGLPRAREMLYTGRIFGADEAARIGLINGVVPARNARGRVLETAEKVAAMAPVAVRLTKSALRHGPRSYAEALEWEALAQPITMATADMREGSEAQGDAAPRGSKGGSWRSPGRATADSRSASGAAWSGASGAPARWRTERRARGCQAPAGSGPASPSGSRFGRGLVLRR